MVGLGADANVLATEGGAGASSRRSFRSTNGGSSWSVKDIDSADAVVPLGASNVAVGLHPDFWNNGVAYLGVPAVNGGVMKTRNRGASWQDTGLGNRASFATTVNVVNDATWFVRTSTAGTAACLAPSVCEWYLTTNMGDGAGYVRVVRSNQPTELYDFEEMDRSPTFATDGVAYLTRRGTGANRIIKSTDGGSTWKGLTTNPTDTTQVTVLMLLSATTVYIGTSEGKTLWTADGGGSWQESTTDVGGRVLDIDFARDFATSHTLFVTAVSTANAYEVWKSTDGGRTFGLLGTSVDAWGSGTGATPFAVLTLSALSGANKTLYLQMLGAGNNDIWRINYDDPKAKWTGLGVATADQPVISLQSFAAVGVGDGELMYFNATGKVGRTYYPLTLNTTNYASLVLPTRRTFGDGTGAQTSFLGLRAQTSPQGLQHYRVAAGRITNLLEPLAFLRPPVIAAPADNAGIPTNTGENGVPTTLTWSNIDGVQSWDVQIALDA
ncbi:MAG: hypothetical protein NTZ05_16375, partial [Chloroflexi bacterium]|nr:hypothetical protein [Chloroflexota bacterium]